MARRAKTGATARRNPVATSKATGDPLARTEKALRKHALGYPEAHEDFPWGECAFKVKKKVFLFMGMGKSGLSLSMKLPKSGAAALMFPFTEPTHYGLGKNGWVTARFSDRQTPPIDLLCEWTDESYRAVAPKKLVATLPERSGRPGGPAVSRAPDTSDNPSTRRVGIKRSGPGKSSSPRAAIGRRGQDQLGPRSKPLNLNQK